MKLWVVDEFSPLKKVVVCWGEHVPEYGNYKSNDPEFVKFHHYKWDKKLLLQQQEQFFNKLESCGVKVIFPKGDMSLPWQLYVRDTAFVLGDKFYYSLERKFGDRNGEIDRLFDVLKLKKKQIVEVRGEVEGGDVLIRSEHNIYLGNSSRTDEEAVKFLSGKVTTRVFQLGDKVMHLDTRFTLLPKNRALVFPGSFSKSDLRYLSSKLKLLEVKEEEARKLATNVLVVNPEVVFVPLQHSRIGKLLKDEGFKVEMMDYTEPIALGGSFRCTTLPIERQ